MVAVLRNQDISQGVVPRFDRLAAEIGTGAREMQYANEFTHRKRAVKHVTGRGRSRLCRGGLPEPDFALGNTFGIQETLSLRLEHARQSLGKIRRRGQRRGSDLVGTLSAQRNCAK